jgi:hypothetical protein
MKLKDIPDADLVAMRRRCLFCDMPHNDHAAAIRLLNRDKCFCLHIIPMDLLASLNRSIHVLPVIFVFLSGHQVQELSVEMTQDIHVRGQKVLLYHNPVHDTFY